MLGKFTATNNLLAGKPAGGHVRGCGLSILWQDGPLGRGEDRKEPNGAFVETVIAAVVQRIEFYQEAGFECQENVQALYYLGLAVDVLDSRTKSRESAGVEGTHERRSDVSGASEAPTDPGIPERKM